MANFNLGSLADWVPLGVGELVQFDVADDGFRAVDFDLLADVPVAVFAFAGDDSWLVAKGDGLMNVRFVTARPVGVAVMLPEDAQVWLRSKARSQRVEDDGSVSYTSIEPRQSSQDAQFARMMNIMKLNQLQRENALRAEFEARLSAQAEAAQVIEREPVQAAPAAAVSTEGGAA